MLMSLSARIKILIALWFVGEAVVFVIIAKLIGFPEAVLLGVLTSFLGWTLLKRAGASAMVKLRAALGGRRIVEGGRADFLDDTLATLGALALLMPGFISDAIGLVLAVPAARDRVSGWIGGHRLFGLVRAGPGPKGPATIDLDPDDWKRADSDHRPVSKY